MRESETNFRGFVIEKVVPGLPLEKIENPSFKNGVELENKGKWEEAMKHFYTLSISAENVSVRAMADIHLSQNLINKGRFGQARKFLTIAEGQKDELSGNELHSVSARIAEKRAWICDYEGNYRGEVRQLTKSREELDKIPPDERGVDEEHLESTINHFLGRAYYGMAVTTRDKVKKQEYFEKAISQFKGEAERLREKREKGNPEHSNEGFQHAWLTRTYTIMGRKNPGNLKLAEEELKLTKKLFSEHAKEVPESGIMAHYYLLSGALMLQKDKPSEAREEFERAYFIRINPKKENYPKGRSDALGGIALSSYYEGEYGRAIYYLIESIKAYPIKVLRPF